SYEEAKSHSAQLGVPIGKILAKGQYEDSEQGYGQFKADLETFASGNVSVRQKLVTVLKTINPDVIEQVGKCLLQKGLHAWLETTAVPEVFKLAVVFNSPGDPVEAKILANPKVTNAKCTWTFIHADARIGGATRRDECRRKPTDPVTVTVNASVDVEG